jgi:hypothetical protein
MENDKSDDFYYTIICFLPGEKAEVSLLQVNFKDLPVCVRTFQEVGFRLLRNTVPVPSSPEKFLGATCRPLLTCPVVGGGGAEEARL